MSADPTRPASHEPFSIAVDDAVLDDLRTRLAATRWPGQLAGSGWSHGAPEDEVRELCRVWADGFDWRAAEARLNALPHFTTDIDGENVHYVHVRSPHADALPLIVTHGWPGSIVEFLDVIAPLTDPTSFGGDAADAFHLVLPSIPGYGFSGPTRTPGVHVGRVAGMWAELMASLGYDRYAAQGGDWGSIITSQLGLLDGAHLVGIHLNMVIVRPSSEHPTDDEQARMAEAARFQAEETGYSSIQRTRPQTLAYGLNDSPAGLAAWIYEKFRVWSDHDGLTGTPFTAEQLLTNLTIYWVTGTILSSMRLYYETTAAGLWSQTRRPRVDVPTGGLIGAWDLMRPTRAWAEAAYNIVHWTESDRGGHFMAMEQPDLFVVDVRSCFRTLR